MDVERWLEQFEQKDTWYRSRNILIFILIVLTIIFGVHHNRYFTIISFLCIVLILNVIKRLDCKQFNQAFHEVDDILYNECDARKYMLVMTQFYNFYQEGRLKHLDYAGQYIEQRYVIALLVNGDVEEAENFLKIKYSMNRKYFLYKVSVFQVAFMKAYLNKDMASYPMNYKLESYVFRHSPIYKARKDILFHDDKKATVLLENYQTRNAYEEVVKQYLLVGCYERNNEIGKANQCYDYVIEHGQKLPLCNTETLERTNMQQVQQTNSKHSYSFVCDNQYYKDLHRNKHVLLTAVGYIGCIAIAFLVVIYLLLFSIKTYYVASILMKLLPYLFLLMVSMLIIYIGFLHFYKQKEYNLMYTICFYADRFEVIDKFGVVDRGIQILVKHEYFEVITASKKKYVLLIDRLTRTDLEVLHRHVTKYHPSRLRLVFKRLFWIIGILSYGYMAVFSYLSYEETHPKQAVQSEGMIDRVRSADGKYSVCFEVLSDLENANHAICIVQLYYKNQMMGVKSVTVKNDMHEITKDNWSVEFEDDAIYVSFFDQGLYEETLKLHYIKENETINDDAVSNNDSVTEVQR